MRINRWPSPRYLNPTQHQQRTFLIQQPVSDLQSQSQSTSTRLTWNTSTLVFSLFHQSPPTQLKNYPTIMCYFDQYCMPCGDWKWGNFKAHCSKEYRTGETCGMKLVWENINEVENCRVCQRIETKTGKIRKDQDRIKRWRKEGNTRRASIETAEEAIACLEREIWDLNQQRPSVKYSLRA